jgi:hypothetical protein
VDCWDVFILVTMIAKAARDALPHRRPSNRDFSRLCAFQNQGDWSTDLSRCVLGQPPRDKWRDAGREAVVGRGDA